MLDFKSCCNTPAPEFSEPLDIVVPEPVLPEPVLSEPVKSNDQSASHSPTPSTTATNIHLEANIFSALGKQLKVMGAVIEGIGVSSTNEIYSRGVIQTLEIGTSSLAKLDTVQKTSSATQHRIREGFITTTTQASPRGALSSNPALNNKVRENTWVEDSGTRSTNTSPAKSAISPTKSEQSETLKQTSTSKSRPESIVSQQSMIIQYEPGSVRGYILQIVNHTAFDMVIGVVIFINALTIGIETNSKVTGNASPPWLTVIEYVFLVIYILELALRIIAFGIPVFQSKWVKFDAMLVICGCLNVFLDLLVTEESDIAAILNQVMLVRMLRLARLARVVRLMVNFQVLYLLVQGLLESLQTLVWTFVVIALLVYVFAVLGLEIIPMDKESMSAQYRDIVDERFGDFQRAALTLLQGLTFDGLSEVYGPLLLERPVLYLYFVPFILVVSIALMNLVTAIMVEHAIKQSEQDKQRLATLEKHARKTMIKELRQVFRRLDQDHSSTLTLDELLDCPADIEGYLSKILNTNNPQEIADIFKALDFDNSGSIGIDEFCDGLVQILDGKTLELAVIMKQCRDILEMSREELKLISRERSNSRHDLSAIVDVKI